MFGAPPVQRPGCPTTRAAPDEAALASALLDSRVVAVPGALSWTDAQAVQVRFAAVPLPAGKAGAQTVA